VNVSANSAIAAWQGGRRAPRPRESS